jgi:predicted Fe-Mo cluster-binding NifX family protein
MKIAVTTSGNDLEGNLDSRFGRAPCFLIIDLESGGFEVINNAQNLNAPQGAGIQAATTVVNSGVQVVITGHCGPKAFRVLKEAGIRIFNTGVKTVKEAVELYTKGKLGEATNADVEGHWM